MILLQELSKLLSEVFRYFLGNFDGLISTLIIIMISDFLTGILSSAVNHRFDKHTLLKETARKICILILIGITHTIDLNLLNGTDLLRNSVLLFFISREGISVCKNASELEIPIPDRLKKELLRMTRNDKEDES